MSKQRINVTEHGLSSNDKEKEREIKRKINQELHELNLAYDKCKCNTCRISILNKLEDIVNAELFFWYETLEAPLNAGESLELEALDNSIENIAALHELIDKFNSLRKQLLNS
jgi:hypothetical protein